MAEPDKPDDGGRAGEVVPPRPNRRCPICGKPSVRTYYPFCSKRCADIDLHSWLSGRYSIPAVEEDGTVDETAGEGSDKE